jgi:hypothetical protein
MKLERYEVKAGEERMIFEFIREWGYPNIWQKLKRISFFMAKNAVNGKPS